MGIRAAFAAALILTACEVSTQTHDAGVDAGAPKVVARPSQTTMTPFGPMRRSFTIAELQAGARCRPGGKVNDDLSISDDRYQRWIVECAGRALQCGYDRLFGRIACAKTAGEVMAALASLEPLGGSTSITAEGPPTVDVDAVVSQLEPPPAPAPPPRPAASRDADEGSSWQPSSSSRSSGCVKGCPCGGACIPCSHVCHVGSWSYHRSGGGHRHRW
jgi:hypothetical protein